MNKKVSCLCVTQNRANFLARSIDLFNAQTHENKELVVVCPATDKETLDVLEKANQPNVIVHKTPKKDLTLGELRNISIEVATGDYICQWDDDDWFHCNRIKTQLETLNETNKRAIMTSRLFVYNSHLKRGYIPIGTRAWESSVLADRQYLLDNNIKYPPLRRKEDSRFTEELLKRDVVLLHDMCDLIIYIFTGVNTWHKNHFMQIFSMCRPLMDGDNQIMVDTIEGRLDIVQASKLLTNIYGAQLCRR